MTSNSSNLIPQEKVVSSYLKWIRFIDNYKLSNILRVNFEKYPLYSSLSFRFSNAFLIEFRILLNFTKISYSISNYAFYIGLNTISMSSKVTSTGALDNLFHGTFRINFPTELNFILTGKSRDSIILGFN